LILAFLILFARAATSIGIILLLLARILAAALLIVTILVLTVRLVALLLLAALVLAALLGEVVLVLIGHEKLRFSLLI
jgi:hypothetical protein